MNNTKQKSVHDCERIFFLVGAGGFTLRVKFVRYANRRIVCPSCLRLRRTDTRWTTWFESTIYLSNKRKTDILLDVCFSWWERVDSNHRRRCQQIYSLPPLATREHSHIKFAKKWSWWTDSNPRPADYKSAALPTELHQHLNRGDRT